MRRLLFILFLLLPLIIVAQAPIWRNSFTTNQAPPVIGTNVGISNTASSFMWKFYGGSDPNRVAVLSDITGGSATNAIGNLNGYGTNTTFFGPLVWGSTNVMDEIAEMIRRSNGFGTNLSIKGTFNVDSNLWVTNDDGPWTRVGINTNRPNATLHINSMYWFTSFLITSNEWRTALKPTLIVTGSCVGIGIFKPIVPLEVAGNSIIGGWMRITNGLRVAGGMAVIQDFTNSGTAYLTNIPPSGNQTVLAINTNAVTGVSVVQIAAGTNGSTGRAPTNQWVILYTNAIYGKGFAVETNGAVTASSFTGITPGGGAFISDLNGNGTNTTLYSVGTTNIAYWTDKEWTLTNTGYGTRMRWQAPLGSLKTDGAFSAGGGATIGDGLVVTNNVVVFGAVYAQGFTNTSAPAIFSDVTPSKIAVFGPDRDLTNSTIDAADLAKLGATNFDSLFVTNNLVASNIVATNFVVDTFTSSTLQLSNALEVRFGGTGTNTNVLGAFFIGNGTNPVVFLDTNDYANWLSNQVVTTVAANGTNFPMIRVTNMADVGLGLLLRTNVMPSAATVGNKTAVSLAVSNIGGVPELWFMHSTNGTGLHVPMRQDFGRTFFDKPTTMSDELLFNGGDIALSTNATSGWHIYPSNSILNIMKPTGGAGLMGVQISTNSGGTLSAANLNGMTVDYTVVGSPFGTPCVAVVSGDSLSTNYAATTNWFQSLTTNFLIGAFVSATNTAVAGQTAGTIWTNFDTQIGAHSPGAGTNAVLFIWAGINDLAAGFTGETIFGFLTNIWATAKASNFTVVAFTVSDSLALTLSQKPNRVWLNTLIRNASSSWDYLVDVAQTIPGPEVKYWYADQVHQANVGTRLIAYNVSEVLKRGKHNQNSKPQDFNLGQNWPDKLVVGNYNLGYINQRNFAWRVIVTNAFPGILLDTGSNAFGILPVGAETFLFSRTNAGSFTYTAADVAMKLRGTEVTFPNSVMVSNSLTTSNLFAINVTASNGLTLPFASDIPTAASLSNAIWRFYNSNGIAFLESTYDGTNKRTWTFSTNGNMSTPLQITSGSTINSGGGVIAAQNSAFQVSARTKLFSYQDGTFSIKANSAVTASGNAGGVLLFDNGGLVQPSAPSILTNKNFGIGVSNGIFTVITSTNGTNLNMVMGVGSSNAWVQTQMEPNQPIACYGAMMFGNTNYGQVFGASAYTNIVGFNVWNTNWFIVNTNTGYMTNVFAGYYRCTINISMLGQNSGIYEGCMLTNGVDSELIGFKHQHDTPARLRSASGIGVIYLPANTGCSFAMKCDVPGSIQIHRGSMTIGTP